MRHASASGHLILWNKKLLTTFPRRQGIMECHVPREKAARVSRGGLVYPMLGYPARGPVSWHRRSESSNITDSAGVWFHGTPSKLCAVQHALRLGAEPSWARWRFQRSGEEGGRRWLRTLPIGLSSILSKSWFSRPALPWSRWLSFLLGTSCPS